MVESWANHGTPPLCQVIWGSLAQKKPQGTKDPRGLGSEQINPQLLKKLSEGFLIKDFLIVGGRNGFLSSFGKGIACTKKWTHHHEWLIHLEFCHSPLGSANVQWDMGLHVTGEFPLNRGGPDHRRCSCWNYVNPGSVNTDRWFRSWPSVGIVNLCQPHLLPSISTFHSGWYSTSGDKDGYGSNPQSPSSCRSACSDHCMKSLKGERLRRKGGSPWFTCGPLISLCIECILST